MKESPAGPRPRRSVVPLEALTPPWWARADIASNSGSPRDAGGGHPAQVVLQRSAPGPGPPNPVPSLAPAEGAAAASALIQRVRQVTRRRHYSLRTEKSCAGWVRRFLVFHRCHDTARLGAAEVRAYLTHLAVRQRVSASTQNQAFSALLFLFREVLGRKLEHLQDTARA